MTHLTLTAPQALFQGRAADLQNTHLPARAATEDSGNAPVRHAVAPDTPPLRLAVPNPFIPDLALLLSATDEHLPKSDMFTASAGISSFSPLPSSSGASGPVAALSTQIVVALATGSRSVTEVALAPEELGQVRLTIHSNPTDPDRLVVMMMFERPEVMELFRRNADQLQADLRAAGYSGADLSYSHSGSGQRQNSSGSEAQTPSLALVGQTPNAFTPPPTQRGSSSSLDLRL